MPTIKQVLELAQSQVGTTEYPPNSNNVIYNTEFYGHPVQDGVPTANDKYPWCAVFVWWVFNQFTPCLVKKTASCMQMGQWFKNNGRWYSTPMVGDVVFFKFSTNNRWTNHVGIVKEVNPDGSIVDYEGNTSMASQDNGGCVMERKRSANIVGYGRPAYESDTRGYKQGVDVSEYQGKINFDKMKAAGISFMSIRATKKNGTPDAYFERNLQECMNRNIEYSCYKYAYAQTCEQAIIEADTVINLLGGRKMVIWYDVEDKSLIPLGKIGIESLVHAFAAECKKAGYEVGIYCNKNWWDNYISDNLKANYDFWIARYGKNNGQLDEKYKPTGKNIVAWQYTSRGQVPGISGYTDCDVKI